MWLIRSSRSASASASPANGPPDGITRHAPDSRASHISSTDASKLGDANCETRSPAATPQRSILSAAKLAMPACSTTTPLGRPVEPEV